MTEQATAQRGAVGEDIFAERSGAAAQPGAVARATDLGGVSVLKHDDLYLLSDIAGDVIPGSHGLGLYESDTRLLSRFELRLNGDRPIVLRSGGQDGHRMAIHLSNADRPSPAGEASAADQDRHGLRRHSLGVLRERLISGLLRERITVSNFSATAQPARLEVHCGADFADMFEVRGALRERRGEKKQALVDGARSRFAYRGLDGVERTVWLQADGASAEVAPEGDIVIACDWRLQPGESRALEVLVWSDASAGPAAFDEQRPARELRAWREAMELPGGGDQATRGAIDRAVADLRMLLNVEPASGISYLAAGLPWFSTLFGRDTLIAAWQLLPFQPLVARDTLVLLAGLQASATSEWQDAQPGKIMHELRTGEMARAGEVPHTPYYGTVDATPLWLILLDEYEQRTGDLATVERLWPNALAALGWIELDGDPDGDGFVEYERRSRRGLASQGWKDSPEAVRFANGTLAEGPIALVEVQAYAYAARRGVARLARRLGEEALSERQTAAAETLRARFEDAYWMPDAGTYAMALDGRKRQVDGLASNAGHALWAGIAADDRAASVARLLTRSPMWSGWGIRTLSSDAVGYNPIGYHIGTVWPHDNALCAAGFARYGLLDEARLVARTLLEAARHFPDSRMPELYCGFGRDAAAGPVPYPVACAPQAWAAAAVLQLAGLLGGGDG